MCVCVACGGLQVNLWGCHWVRLTAMGGVLVQQCTACLGCCTATGVVVVVVSGCAAACLHRSMCLSRQKPFAGHAWWRQLCFGWWQCGLCADCCRADGSSWAVAGGTTRGLWAPTCAVCTCWCWRLVDVRRMSGWRGACIWCAHVQCWHLFLDRRFGILHHHVDYSCRVFSSHRTIAEIGNACVAVVAWLLYAEQAERLWQAGEGLVRGTL